MVPLGWAAVRPSREPEASGWLGALEPLTTGLLAQDDLKLWCFGTQAALGIRAGGVVYPVFPGPTDLFLEAGARTLLDRVADSWCLMGPADWVLRAEPLMPPSRIQHRVAYEFLYRPCDKPGSVPGPGEFRPGKPGDLEALFPLQEAYEKEEVLFDPREFNSLASRSYLIKTLRHQELGAIWIDGEPVAKAGSNALTAAWAQVGGVYTLPAWRGRGLQKRLISFLLARWAEEGRGACLFVKAANTVALGLYRSLGFLSAGAFTITYGWRRAPAPVFH